MGLWALLEKSEERETIINTYPDRLLTFKKWSLFKQAKLTEDILIFLQSHLSTASLNLFFAKKKRYETAWANEKEWAESMDKAILMSMLGNNDFEKVCKQDKDLKNFIEQHLALELAEKEAEFKELQSIKAAWDKVN